MVVFGLGARICLGMEVAYLEMYKVIPEASLMMHYIWKKIG